MKTTMLCWLLATLAAALLAGCGSSSQSVSRELPPPSGPDLIENIPYDPAKQAYTETRGVVEYVLGPGDGLDMVLRGLEMVRERVVVRNDGNISFSLVENIRAAGLTVSELDESLTNELRRYLRDPKLDMEVADYKSKMVLVQGAILSVFTVAGQKTGPGRYPVKGKIRVLDMLLDAGGTTPDAQLDRVQLIRGDKSYRLNIQRVLQTGDPRENVVLQADDMLFVPGIARQSKKVVVLGEFRNPSVFVFSEDVTFLEAIGQAGGLTDEAIRSDVRVIRNVDGTPRMFSLNYERLVKGEDLDRNVPLESNDVIYASRSFIGDLNDAIAKIKPLLDLLLLPGTYGNIYTTGGSQWLNTGPPPATTGPQIFTQPLPGTGKLPVPADSTAQGN
ncbi:MAG: polysaccharide export protein [Candidatus Handelsmanbacteria bacterium]|nr:polysaccharide export protein [Candidatus Handelsmanbacteria bacterium]